MKKLFLIVFAVLVSSTTFAQGIDLGIKAGVNFISFSDAVGFDNNTGFVVGVFSTLKFSDKIALQGDLLYSQQGAEVDFEDLDIGNEVDKLDLNYINVPVVLKYYVVKKLNIQAGPQFGFVVDDNIGEVFNGISNNISTNSFALTGVVGVGLDLPLGLRATARYNFGLTDIFENYDGKHNVITISAGFSFL